MYLSRSRPRKAVSYESYKNTFCAQRKQKSRLIQQILLFTVSLRCIYESTMMHVRQDFLRKCWLVPHTDAIKWLQKTFPFEAWNLQYPFIAVVWKRTTNAAFIKSPFVLYRRRKVKQVLNDMRGSKCNCMCADWTWDEKRCRGHLPCSAFPHPSPAPYEQPRVSNPLIPHVVLRAHFTSSLRRALAKAPP